MTLDQAADEFARRAMLPEYGAGDIATAERVRILACAQWLRDMAQDERTESSGPECSVVYRNAEHGYVHFKTPTAAELIAFLRRFPPDLPVIATWEGTTHGFSNASLTEYQTGQVLEFDVEYDKN